MPAVRRYFDPNNYRGDLRYSKAKAAVLTNAFSVPIYKRTLHNTGAFENSEQSPEDAHQNPRGHSFITSAHSKAFWISLPPDACMLLVLKIRIFFLFSNNPSPPLKVLTYFMDDPMKTLA